MFICLSFLTSRCIECYSLPLLCRCTRLLPPPHFRGQWSLAPFPPRTVSTPLYFHSEMILVEVQSERFLTYGSKKPSCCHQGHCSEWQQPLPRWWMRMSHCVCVEVGIH